MKPCAARAQNTGWRGAVCHGSARLPGVALGSEKYSPRLQPGSLQPGPRNQTTPPSLPGIPRHDRDTRTPGRPHGCSRRLWLFGTWESGGTRAEGCCPGEEELGTRSPRLSRGPALTPLLPKGHARGQGRWGPASGLWVHSVPPGIGDREGRCRATDSTTRGGQGRAKKVGSRVKRPRAGSSLQMARCWESPQPHSSPETKAGGCEVWQFGLQVLVSITHPGQPSASLTWPQPLGARKRPPFQPPLCLPGPS